MTAIRTTALICAVINTALWLGIGITPWPAVFSWVIACAIEVLYLLPSKP